MRRANSPGGGDGAAISSLRPSVEAGRLPKLRYEAGKKDRLVLDDEYRDLRRAKKLSGACRH
jgi:hypothetical protein